MIEQLKSIERSSLAIEAIKAGKMVILVDDEDRENEGDLTMAAELVTPEAITFIGPPPSRTTLMAREPASMPTQRVIGSTLSYQQSARGAGDPGPV